MRYTYTLAVTQDLLAKAESGRAWAQNDYGILCVEGTGVLKDPAEGVKWLAKAAKQGHAAAQRNLGVCYKEGTGVKANASKSLRLFRQAAMQGNPEAQFALGVALLRTARPRLQVCTEVVLQGRCPRPA